MARGCMGGEVTRGDTGADARAKAGASSGASAGVGAADGTVVGAEGGAGAGPSLAVGTERGSVVRRIAGLRAVDVLSHDSAGRGSICSKAMRAWTKPRLGQAWLRWATTKSYARDQDQWRACMRYATTATTDRDWPARQCTYTVLCAWYAASVRRMLRISYRYTYRVGVEAEAEAVAEAVAEGEWHVPRKSHACAIPCSTPGASTASRSGMRWTRSKVAERQRAGQPPRGMSSAMLRMRRTPSCLRARTCVGVVMSGPRYRKRGMMQLMSSSAGAGERRSGAVLRRVSWGRRGLRGASSGERMGAGTGAGGLRVRTRWAPAEAEAGPGPGPGRGSGAWTEAAAEAEAEAEPEAEATGVWAAAVLALGDGGESAQERRSRVLVGRRPQ